MQPDGTVTLTTGLQSNGQGHETTMAQVAADQLGVRVEDVTVVQGDTAATAYATGSYGSRTAVIGSGAIIRAAGDVRDKLLAVAAHLFEASAEDLELGEGRISVLGSPDRSFSIREVATAAYWGPRPADIDPSLVATRSYDPPETYSNACIAVVVEVDAATGQVRIERIVAVEDCGTVLNPAVVEGQVIGAIAQGIGAVLYEQLPYDEDGNFLAGTLADFLYPTAPEVPAIEVDHLETPSPVTEGGMKGMGEGGLIGGPSAIVNAISDALGVPVDRTPLRPCDVLELVRLEVSRIFRNAFFVLIRSPSNSNRSQPRTSNGSTVVVGRPERPLGRSAGAGDHHLGVGELAVRIAVEELLDALARRIAARERPAHELGAEGRVVDAVVAPEREHALGVAAVPGRQRLVQPLFGHLARHGATLGRSRSDARSVASAHGDGHLRRRGVHRRRVRADRTGERADPRPRLPALGRDLRRRRGLEGQVLPPRQAPRSLLRGPREAAPGASRSTATA